MEKERPFLVYPVRKPTILREKKELPRDHHRFLFFCLFIINLAALLKIYQSNQYLNKLTVITQNFRSDIDKLAIHHRLLLTKLQQLVRQFNFKDVVKTFNTTSDGTWGIPSVCNWKELEHWIIIECFKGRCRCLLFKSLRIVLFVFCGAKRYGSTFVVKSQCMWNIDVSSIIYLWVDV